MSRPNPRPKRPADLSSLTPASSSKKPRFDSRNPSRLAADAPDEDAILDLDEIGKGPQTKRSAVYMDGFDSDSDDDNFDTRAEARARAMKAAENGEGGGMEDDDDMFAESDDGGEDKAGGKGGAGRGREAKKEVRFLEGHEIEGQVLDSKSGGHVSADFTLDGDTADGSKGEGDGEARARSSSVDSDDSDVDEEVGAGGKKHHAPKLDAFNVRQEEEDGRFDESGNYVRKAVDPNAVHDGWLEGLSRKDMRRAREAQEKRDEEVRRRGREMDEVLTGELVGRLVGLLQRGETVLEALQRLGKGATKQKGKGKGKWQKNRRKEVEDMDVDVEAEVEDPKEARRRREVEAITEAADQLLTRGQSDIYETEREMLMRQYRNETDSDWVEGGHGDGEHGGGAAGEKEKQMWEYRWSDARDCGEHYGPYDGETMVAWNEAGYFAEGVEFRSVGGDEWSRVCEFVTSG